MIPMQITSWPIHKCELSSENYDKIFHLTGVHGGQSSFLKPFIGIKNRDYAAILVDGKRLQYYRERGKIQDVPVYLLPEICSKFEILQALTDYFLYDHDLNNLVIAELLQHLSNLNIPAEARTRFISKKLKISPKPEITQKYIKFLAIDETITAFLIQKKAPLKAWEYMAEIQEQNFFIELIQTTSPSLSIFLEIVENMVELQKISSRTISDLITKLGINRFLKENDCDNPLQKIREKILQHRFPKISERRHEIDTLFSEISLPPNLNLHYDRTFEKKEIRGFFDIHSSQDFDNLKSFLSIKNTETLDKILKKL